MAASQHRIIATSHNRNIALSQHCTITALLHHSVAASQRCGIAPSQHRDITSSRHRGITSSQRRGITSSQRRGITALQRRGITALWHRAITSSQCRAITSSQCRGIAASQHHSIVASHHHGIAPSHHRSVATSQHCSVATSQRRGIAESHHHGITASRHHIIAASRHHSIAALQHHSVAALQDHTITASHHCNITSLQHHSVVALQDHTITASRHRTITSSQHCDITALQCCDITPSRHCRITPSRHHSITPSHHRSVATSQHCSVATSHHHGITSLQHHSVAASQRRGIAASHHRGITAPRHPNIAASRHCNITASDHISPSCIMVDPPKKPSRKRAPPTGTLPSLPAHKPLAYDGSPYSSSRPHIIFLNGVPSSAIFFGDNNSTSNSERSPTYRDFLGNNESCNTTNIWGNPNLPGLDTTASSLDIDANHQPCHDDATNGSTVSPIPSPTRKSYTNSTTTPEFSTDSTTTRGSLEGRACFTGDGSNQRTIPQLNFPPFPTPTDGQSRCNTVVCSKESTKPPWDSRYAASPGDNIASPLVPLLHPMAPPPYTPLPIGNHKPRFAGIRNLKTTVDSLLEIIFPHTLMERIQRHSNNHLRKSGSMAPAITISELYIFLAMYYYMGVWNAPSKRDYWRGTCVSVPTNTLMTHLSRNRYDIIFQHIHFTAELPDDDNGSSASSTTPINFDVNEDDMRESADSTTIASRSELSSISTASLKVSSAESKDTGAFDTKPPAQKKAKKEGSNVQLSRSWYRKVQPLLDHTNRVAKRICTRPGSACAIDEMMVRFKGRSAQTHRMKMKPIKEGFKFFALCCSSTGFMYHILPAGRLDKTTRINNTVEELMNELDRRHHHVVTMDNFFTTKMVLQRSRQMGIGILGTARNRNGFPPKAVKEVEDDRFNSLYIWTEPNEHVVTRWVDNNIVLMVSTVHYGNETVLRDRHKPRETRINKKHLKTVWGDDWNARIRIPKMINDYNHWMGGVDRCDQLISYYRPNIRCRRIWMPLMFHFLDILRVNAWISHCHLADKEERLPQKEFTLEMVEALVRKSSTSSSKGTRSTEQIPRLIVTRHRMRASAPTLPEARLMGEEAEHEQVIVKGEWARTCRYCAFLGANAKLSGKEGTKPKRVTRMCSFCRVYICSEHWDIYHGKT